MNSIKGINSYKDCTHIALQNAHYENLSPSDQNMESLGSLDLTLFPDNIDENIIFILNFVGYYSETEAVFTFTPAQFKDVVIKPSESVNGWNINADPDNID